MYLLDTNVVSETRKPRPHGAVMAWLASVDRGDLNISAVSLGEIQAGIEITREQDPARAALFDAWAENLSRVFNVLPMDGAIFRLWAKLMHRRSSALAGDAMIAATARHHQLIVVTRNVRDFRDFGVEMFDPFASPRTAS